jgi:hypothetical protein
MTSERLMTRALASSVGIWARKPAAVETCLGERALSFDETLFRLRLAEDRAVLGRNRFVTLARLSLSHAA